MPAPPSHKQGNISPRQICDHSATPGNVPMYADDGTLMDSGQTPGSGGGGGGSGALVLLAELTASSSASLDFTTRNVTGQSGAIFQSDFDNYLIMVTNLRPTTNNDGINMFLSTNGGSSYDATSGHYETHYAYNYGGGAGIGTPASTSWIISGTNTSNSASLGGVRATLWLFNPLSTVLNCSMHGQTMNYDNAAAGILSLFLFQRYTQTGSAVNAFQVKPTTGASTIADGIVRVYGLSK